MRTVKYLYILLFVIITSLTSAQSPEHLFNKANKEYRSGHFDQAKQQYEALVKEGYHSSALYFNLGNCYYKTGETAKAILNYERAKKINPDDEDVAYNLRLAYSNTVDKVDPVPQLFYERWWSQLLFMFSPDTWSWVAVALLWLAVGLGIWYLNASTIATRKLSFMSGSVTLILACMMFSLAACSHRRINNHQGAVVMEPSAYVRSSPDEKSTGLFMLHAGTRIEVIDELGGWKQIRIANGNVGWMATGALEVI